MLKPEDELFCLSYELRTLSDLLLARKIERWVEGFNYEEGDFDHRQRYALAAAFCKGKHVLDLACGSGRGSRILAEKGAADRVEAYDLDSDTIRYASLRNAHPNVKFAVADAIQFVKPARFDVAVSFETIEHLDKPELLLENVALSLRQDGIFFVSTPVSTQDLDRNPANEYHVQEWGLERFQQLVSRFFSIQRIYIQYYVLDRPPSLLSRTLNKVRSALKPSPARSLHPRTVVNRSRLQPWPEAGLDVNACGRDWMGFQIVQATPLPDSTRDDDGIS